MVGKLSDVTSVGSCPADTQNSSNWPGSMRVSPVAVQVMVSTTWSIAPPPSDCSGVSNVRVVVSMSHPDTGWTET